MQNINYYILRTNLVYYNCFLGVRLKRQHILLSFFFSFPLLRAIAIYFQHFHQHKNAQLVLQFPHGANGIQTTGAVQVTTAEYKP